MNSNRLTAVKPDYIYSNTKTIECQINFQKMRKPTTNANITIAVKLELFCENHSHVRSIYINTYMIFCGGFSFIFMIDERQQFKRAVKKRENRLEKANLMK